MDYGCLHGMTGLITCRKGSNQAVIFYFFVVPELSAFLVVAVCSESTLYS